MNQTAERLQCQNCKHVRRLVSYLHICRPCYDKPEVRLRFRAIYGLQQQKRNESRPPRGRPIGKSGVDWHAMFLPPPESATNAIPGSAHKIAVMRQRVSAGKQIFHEADLTFAILFGEKKTAPKEPFSIYDPGDYDNDD